ncbi:MAG: sugar ABC transporter permease [Clostridia bacterium]|nr:sugar ABC transporter permease [Clostridia bacterium]
MRKKARGVESLRRRYGYSFVAHWVLGLIVFFFIPLVSSIRYAFSEITITGKGFEFSYVGLENFKVALFQNAEYLDLVRDSIGSMFYSLPMIIALSLILAVLLNQKYPGRAIMRVIFFLPVIIESSVIVNLLAGPSINASIFDFSAEGSGFIDYSSIFANLNLPTQITDFLTFFLSNTVSLTWNCGVQIILFLAGLQGIPASLYEVSKIEGANKWDEFWQITVPMLRHVLSLVIIYTMISQFTSANNKVVATATGLMKDIKYNMASAMLWFYFIIVLIVIGIVLALYNHYCLKKWD